MEHVYNLTEWLISLLFVQYFSSKSFQPTNLNIINERSLITSNYIPLNSTIHVLNVSMEGDKDSIYDNCIYATMSMPFSVYDLDLGIKKIINRPYSMLIYESL